MSIYYTNDKTPIQIELKPLASGGEGEVFRVVTAVANLSNQCAKIYFPNQRTKEREEKIKFMVQNTPIQQQNSRFLLCLPTKMLFDKRGKFVGFLMPTAFNGSIQLYELVTTQISKKISNEWHQKYDRTTKQGIENRLKLCTNISIAIHQIHQTRNLVLVDFKPQNILITNDAKVSVIDLDSIQISNGRNVIYPAKVATPEYTPKEAERLNPSVDYIPETWDRFSLAVVFYEILFGIHPYTSTAGGQYSDISTISEKISKNLFVHGSKKSYLITIPPIHKNYELLPNGLKLLFLSAFENGNQTPTKRPTAESWGQEITEELKNINIRPNLITTVQKPVLIKETKTTVKTNIPQQTNTPVKNTSNSNSNNGGIGTVIILILVGLFIIFAFFEISKKKSTSDDSLTSVAVDSVAIDTTATAAVENPINEFGSGNGKYFFWTRTGEDGIIKIYIDDKKIGQLNQHFTGEYTPSCGEDGTVSAVLSTGYHSFKAIGATQIWKGSITVKEGVCDYSELLFVSDSETTIDSAATAIVDSVKF